MAPIFVDELDEVPEGSTVVFSAHGVSPEVHRQAAERRLKTIDATCPLVTKVHHEARRFADEDYDILLIGHAGHEEVEGTSGEAPGHVTLVQTPDDVAGVQVRDPGRVAWLSQTTLSVDETMQTVDRLRARFPGLVDPPSDDICYATQNRQQAVKKIAEGADLVLVVGSANSSNSVRLVEVALEGGAAAAYRVDDASEIQESWFDGVRTVGVTSGASVPESLVAEVLDLLHARGFPAAVAVPTAEESLIFALPPSCDETYGLPRWRPRRREPQRVREALTRLPTVMSATAYPATSAGACTAKPVMNAFEGAADLDERVRAGNRDDSHHGREEQRWKDARGEEVTAPHGHRGNQADSHETEVEEHGDRAGESQVETRTRHDGHERQDADATAGNARHRGVLADPAVSEVIGIAADLIVDLGVCSPPSLDQASASVAMENSSAVSSSRSSAVSSDVSAGTETWVHTVE